MRYLASSTETRLSTLYNEWQILKSEVPKGFEKYFPGGKKTQGKAAAAPKSETKGFIICIFNVAFFWPYMQCQL